uniref:Lipase 3 n=1 Tax=Anopheles minimus TaxID=112268 RepID=A0A182W0D0_9DIPT
MRIAVVLLMCPMLLSAHYYQYDHRNTYGNKEDNEIPVEEDPPFRVSDEDAYLTVPQLVWKYGYEIEIHEVQTGDGYLLDLYRIPGRRAASGQPPLQPYRNAPIFLMHSLLSSCADWVLMGPGRALAYLLADAGYDVWMGNARGTRYSRKHVHLDPDRSNEFWNFTWHEIGLYDVPALIDYVLTVSDQPRLHYAGFSQGTMVLFVLLSERPEYNAKLIDMQAISPSVYMYRLEGRIVRTFIRLADPLVLALDAAGRHEILPNTRFIAPLVKLVCPDANITVCRELLYDVAGKNPPQVDDKMLRIFLGHFPAGASLRQLHHFSQIIRTTRFAKYSPLRAGWNFLPASPAPLYNLTRATIPVVVYYGLNDHVVNYRDALQLADEVPNLAAVHQIADRLFTHSDFILAKNSARLMNVLLLQELEQYDGPELITKYGYPVESHEATGADGYIVSLTRIPPRKHRHQIPILLVHGLLASSADYVIIGPNNSLAYLLADRDYDVWLADMRGNRYSQRHTRLNSSSPEYWDFTWHEMGYYDLPAVIDYILRLTGARQLNYIGHSQGTTVFFVMASSRPEYNEKIAHMYALSPAVCLKRVRSPPVRWLLQHVFALKDLFDAFGMQQFLPHSNQQYEVSRILCPMSDPNNICMQVVSMTVGPNPKMTDMMAMQVLVGHDPAGASVKQLLHYAQLQHSGQFRQFDYGRRNNTERYSYWKPPAYNLSAVTAPITIFYAYNDWLIDPRDVLRFSRMLPVQPTMHLVDDANFNHLDFTMAKNARPMVYEHILISTEMTVVRYGNKIHNCAMGLGAFFAVGPSATGRWISVLCVIVLPMMASAFVTIGGYESVFAIDEEDGTLEATELIQKYGYPIERHEVITADGYVLALTRIPPKDKPTNHSLPMLLVHGLFASSADFLIIGPNNSLAYLLADEGYDVWLVDLRGNRYSRRHTKLRSDSRAYWDYSWHEMGYYDVPATIDHVLHVTGTRRLHYIGYSQGTTVFFVMASSRPEYNDKIVRMYALSPAVYAEHIQSPIFRWLAENSAAVKCFLDTLGLWQVVPHSKAQYALQRALCPARLRRSFCVRLVEQLVGPNPNGTDRLAQHVIGGHNPSGASSKQLLHFAQLNRYGRFQQFDYGQKEQNLAAYGQETPPIYNLSAVTAPVVIFYGLNDWMIHPDNVVRLAAELPNLVSMSAVEDQNFNHLDFMTAKRVRALVYDKILLELQQELSQKSKDCSLNVKLFPMRQHWIAVFKLLMLINFATGKFSTEEIDGTLTTMELINKYGYRAQAYTVTTSDGYRLGVHRLARKEGPDPKLLPILLVHGLLGSSADWVLIGPRDALSYQLANAGYDVWLGNTRGNRYSRQHEQMFPDDAEFWNFSWHEKGIYDLPAMIDFILNTTQPSSGQIYYIGYSEGSTAYFTMTSSVPQHNVKIRLAHAIAPAVLLDNMRSPLIQSLSRNSALLSSISQGATRGEIFKWTEQQNGFLRSLCPPYAKRNPCIVTFENMYGHNSDAIDLGVLQAMMGHCPSGASLKEPMHYNQVIDSGIFRPYQEETERMVKPYNLSASNVPVHIYYALNDWIVHPRNVRRFATVLPNVREIRPLGGKKFTHIDFLIAKRVKTIVYSKIIYNLQNDTRARLAMIE